MAGRIPYFEGCRLLVDGAHFDNLNRYEEAIEAGFEGDALAECRAADSYRQLIAELEGYKTPVAA